MATNPENEDRKEHGDDAGTFGGVDEFVVAFSAPKVPVVERNSRDRLF
jgi:hypothetical protein